MLAIVIFVTTLVFVIWQPKNLNIGWSAIAGAVVALLVGVVNFADVIIVTESVCNATLALVAIILISVIWDEVGLFEWAALHLERRAIGTGRNMLVYTCVFVARVPAFFAN